MLVGAGCGAVEMKMLKSIGESGLPCGTPCVGVIVFCENVLSILILMLLFKRYDCINLVK